MRPRNKTLASIAQALGVSIEELAISDAGSKLLATLPTSNPDLKEIMQQLPRLADDQLSALKIVVRDMLMRSQMEGMLRG